MNFHHYILTAVLSLTITSSIAQNYRLSEQIFLDLPKSALDVSRAEKEKMLKGGQETDEYEPIDDKLYPNGIAFGLDNYLYVVYPFEGSWEMKFWDTNNADEKLVIVRECTEHYEKENFLYTYSVKEKRATSRNLQLPQPTLSDFEFKATEKEKGIFDLFKKPYGNQLITKDFSVADGAIWESINTNYDLEGLDLSKAKPYHTYFFWNGTQFEKANNKKTDISDIREKYSNTKQGLHSYTKKVETDKAMLGGIGEQIRTYTLFENKGKLVFATQQFNIAARNYYDEYLFDENGKLSFCYRRYPEIDGSWRELRFYFRNGLFVKCLLKEKKEGESSFSTTYEGEFIPDDNSMSNYKDLVVESKNAQSKLR